jgi:cold shock CspA family protein
MSDAGYVYVLINPSMEGLVKIRKTTQDPTGRAKELSAATGVPTPFIVVFDAYFEDCSKAEEYVQARLEQKNYRVSSSREFFTVPVNEAVKAVIEAQSVLGMKQSPPTDERDLQNEEIASGIDHFAVGDIPPWHDVFELAQAAHYGLGDTLKDPNEALRLYKQAAKLGSPEACLGIGRLYRDNKDLLSSQQAIAYLKEGASRGVGECYAKMTELFVENRQFDNAHKCWSKYFESRGFVANTHDRGAYGYDYLHQVKYDGLPIMHKEALLQIRDEIWRCAERILEPAAQGQIEKVQFVNPFILFIRYMLYSEMPRNWVRGKVKWFNHDKGYGYIRQDSGEEVCLLKSDIVEGVASSLRERQQVEFEIGYTSQGPLACNVRLL